MDKQLEKPLKKQRKQCVARERRSVACSGGSRVTSPRTWQNPAEDEVETDCWKLTEQNKVSRVQDARCEEEPKSSRLEESAGELASDQDSVNTGLDCLAKQNDTCAAKEMTMNEPIGNAPLPTIPSAYRESPPRPED